MPNLSAVSRSAVSTMNADNNILFVYAFVTVGERTMVECKFNPAGEIVAFTNANGSLHPLFVSVLPTDTIHVTVGGSCVDCGEDTDWIVSSNGQRALPVL